MKVLIKDFQVSIADNIATCYLRQEVLANVGRLYCNLILKNGSTILTSFAFYLDVEALAVPAGAVVQSDYINVWQQEIDEAAAVVETATGIVDARSVTKEEVGLLMTKTDTERKEEAQ